MRWCLPRSMLSSSLHLSVWVLGKFRIFNNYSTSARWKSALAMGMGLTRRVAPRSKLLSILVPRAWLSWLHGLETRGWSVKPSGPGDENGYNHLLFMAKPGWLVLSRSGFCTYGTDHMETVQAVYFCFGAKPAISNFATKTAKTNVNIVILHSETTRKAKKIEILPVYWDFKDGWRRQTFSERGQYYPEHLETFDAETETGIAESQETKDDFINQQKSANTDSYWYEHWLFSATLKLMVWKLGKLKAYLRPSLTSLGTRGFSRVRREVSVLAEGRHVFGRRKPR